MMMVDEKMCLLEVDDPARDLCSQSDRHMMQSDR
jgi:hypothetical protein